MPVTAAQVKELREKTGAGIMDAKKALDTTGGDMARAEKLLAEKGLASAAKKLGRETTEGIIASYIHSGSRIGAIVELNCETDFVARTPEFLELGKNLAMQIAAMSPAYIGRAQVPQDAAPVKDEELLLEQAYIRDSSKKIEDLIKETIAKVGENVQVRRFSRFALGE